ncbi:hypothetical protein [Kangiella sp.]|uniref:hypothetical protein n=1 Tax=Kangiella sp. TaxID=1920245 RepID=UPI003A950257
MKFLIAIVLASFSMCCVGEEQYAKAFDSCMDTFSDKQQNEQHTEAENNEIEKICEERAKAYSALVNNERKIFVLTNEYCSYLGNRHKNWEDCLSDNYKKDYDSVELRTMRDVDAAVLIQVVDSLKAAGTKKVLITTIL